MAATPLFRVSGIVFAVAAALSLARVLLGGAPALALELALVELAAAALAFAADARARRAERGARERAALEESESRYRALVEGSPDGIVVLVEGDIAYANPAAARIFGTSCPEVLVGVHGPELIAPESAPLIAQRNRDVERLGVATEPVEVRAHRRDGGVIDIELWGMPVWFGGRQADLSIVRDLTERRRAEEERHALLAATQDQAVTRELVRRMLRETSGIARGSTMRSVGRRLAQDVPASSLQGFLHAFESMGGGRFVVERESRGRFVVRGADLLERRPGAKQPTCELPLGFLEGAIARLAGEGTPGVAALGTETRCQSLGHDACVFVVQARAQAPVVAGALVPGALGKPS